MPELFLEIPAFLKRPLPSEGFKKWKAEMAAAGCEVIELFGEGPCEAAGTGPWGAFKKGEQVAMFEGGVS
jgi:hypothetical protein